jgi:hypothetical protein
MGLHCVILSSSVINIVNYCEINEWDGHGYASMANMMSSHQCSKEQSKKLLEEKKKEFGWLHKVPIIFS